MVSSSAERNNLTVGFPAINSEVAAHSAKAIRNAVVLFLWLAMGDFKRSAVYQKAGDAAVRKAAA